MTGRTLRLDLITKSGKKLIAEVRAPNGFISDAAVVRVSAPDQPSTRNTFRVSELRDLADRISHMGFEDTDPLSVGHGNITLLLVWIDELNGKEGIWREPGG